MQNFVLLLGTGYRCYASVYSSNTVRTVVYHLPSSMFIHQSDNKKRFVTE